MVSDEEYKNLLNRYNKLLSKYEDLAETYKTNKEEWDKMEKHYKEFELRVVDLCDAIKNKSIKIDDYSPKDMVDRVHHASLTFDEYISSKNSLIKQIMDESEDKSATIENLKNQINQMITSGEFGISPNSNVSEGDNELPTSNIAKTEPPSKGKLASIGKRGQHVIIVDNSDTFDGDDELLKKTIEDKENTEFKKIKAISSSIPVFQKRNEARINKIKNETSYEKQKIDELQKLDTELKPLFKEIINIIGGKGKSRTSDIYNEAKRKNPEVLDSQIRTALSYLKNMKLICQESAKNPLSPNLMVFELSEVGVSLYIYMNKKKPVECEMRMIKREHDNLSHGYAILQLYELMKTDKETYADVCIENRKLGIRTNENRAKEFYIPDIKFKENNKYTTYYEYERGTQTVNDYEYKLEKMIKVTKYIYFITENKDVSEKINKIIQNWAKKKNPKVLDGYKAKICTAIYFRDNIFPKKTDKWQIEYNFSVSNEPETIS